MKNLILFAFALLLASCTSTDDDARSDGLCNGYIRDVGEDGTVYDEVPVSYYCSECGKLIYWVCPDPGTCGQYYDAVGIFECN